MQNSSSLRWSYALGGFGQNLIYGLMSSYFLFFFTDVSGMSAAAVGTILLVARIYGLFVDPMVAVAIEKTQTKLGKYRTYIGIIPPIISILFIGIFYSPSFSDTAYLIYAYVLTLLFWTAYAFFDISYWSILSSFTQNSEERAKLLTLVKTFALFAGAGVGIVAIPLVKLLGDGNDARGFFSLAVIFSAIFLVFGFLLFKKLKVDTTDITQEGTADKQKNSMKDLGVLLKTNTPLIIAITAKLCVYLGMTIKSSLILYFYKYQLGNEGLYSMYSLVMLVGSFCFVLLTPVVIKKFGTKNAFRVFLIVTLIPVIIYSFSFDNAMIYVILDGIAMGSMGVYSLVVTNMVADTVEYGEWKTGVRAEGIIYSTNTISSKFASGISAALAGWILTGIGYVANQDQSVEVLNKLHWLMVIIPVVGIILTFIAMSFYSLSSERYNEIVAELNKRKGIDGNE